MMPLCGLILSASSSSMDIVAPHWKASGLDVLETIEKYTRVLFHFTCFPLVLIIRAVYARMPRAESEAVGNMMIGTVAQVLIAKHMDDAEVEGDNFVKLFNKMFEEILAMNVGAYFKDDLDVASKKFSALVLQDVLRLFEDAEQQVIAQVVVPEAVSEYTGSIGPDFVRLASEFVDAITQVE